jgi:hypothetical protein
LYVDTGLFLAALIADSAGCLAGRLTGSLTFATAAVSEALLQVALMQGFDMLHSVLSLSLTNYN